MNYHLHIFFFGDHYEVHMRDSTIVRILCNNHEVQYDDLSLVAREAILIEALQEFAKLRS